MKTLPVFYGYTLDMRLHEFRKCIFGEVLEFIPFNSNKGYELLLLLEQEKPNLYAQLYNY